MTFTKGQRVEVMNGTLEGNRATVLEVGDSSNWDGFVFIHFDNPRLSDEWFEVSRLRSIIE